MSDDRLQDWRHIQEVAERARGINPGGNGEYHGGLQEPPDTDGPADADTTEDGDAENVERRIQFQVTKLRIDREARRRLDDEDHPPLAVPEIKSLTQLLSEPDTPLRYRIDQVAPIDSRLILSAQGKTGKSILVHNLIRALVDGDPFLDHFSVNTTARRVVVVDNELSEDRLRHWLRDQGITNTDAVGEVSLRKARALNLLDDRCRAEWAERLANLGTDFLILDCLRPVLDALGLDENHEAGRFLVAFDALLDEARITDAAIVHHMGHANERARGDSRLEDWPDAIWRMVRDNPSDPRSPRFFSAYGRDVDVQEGQLSYDSQTRRLSYAAGSRTDAKTEAAAIAVIETLAEAREELSGRDIESALADEHSQKAIRAGIKHAVEKNLIEIRRGPHRSHMHCIAYPCSSCGWPVTSRRTRHESCPSGPEGLFK